MLLRSYNAQGSPQSKVKPGPQRPRVPQWENHAPALAHVILMIIRNHHKEHQAWIGQMICARPHRQSGLSFRHPPVLAPPLGDSWPRVSQAVNAISIDAAASLSFSAGAQVPGGNPTETNSTLGVQECQAGWGSGVKGVSQQE